MNQAGMVLSALHVLTCSNSHSNSTRYVLSPRMPITPSSPFYRHTHTHTHTSFNKKWSPFPLLLSCPCDYLTNSMRQKSC